MTKPITKKVTTYPDTAAGALACLKGESLYDVSGAVVVPDPFGKGVWSVVFESGKDKGARVIVYLYGHSPSATRDGYNDFETC